MQMEGMDLCVDRAGWAEMNWETGIDVCALPSIKQLVGTCCIRQGA